MVRTTGLHLLSGVHFASPLHVTVRSGSKLRGSLAITTTGLAPASHQEHEVGQNLFKAHQVTVRQYHLAYLLHLTLCHI